MKINNIYLIITLVVSFLMLFFTNDIKTSKAVTIYGTNYPNYIQRNGQPDLRISSITKNVGFRVNGNEVSTNRTFSTTDAGLTLQVIDDGANINCSTTAGGGCGVYIYGANDGDEGTDDIYRSVSSSNSNVVACDRGSCRVTGGEGSATITISFEYEGGFVYYGPQTTSRNNADSRRIFRFSMSSLSYNFVVERPNTPPTVTSCSLRPTGYNTATASWTYTDREGDPQTQYYISGLIPNSNTSWQTANIQRQSNIPSADISGLVAGGTYNQVQIQVYDGRAWSQPFTCNSITTTEYSEPKYTFRLTGDGKTVNYNDTNKTLILKTGDKVSTNWSVDNDTEVGLESCALSTPNFADLSGSGIPTGSVSNKTVPTIPDDKTYNVNLNCIGKRGYPTRSINQTINLTVESYPVVSCSISRNTTVKEGVTGINIQAIVGNSNGYSWEAQVNKGNTKNEKSGSKISSPNPDTLNISLDYSGTAFGKYDPWIQVAKQVGGASRSREATCGTVSNLGSSTIREVNP
jgi:hypothetical protein